jgi:hypothetical protein
MSPVVEVSTQSSLHVVPSRSNRAASSTVRSPGPSGSRRGSPLNPAAADEQRRHNCPSAAFAVFKPHHTPSLREGHTVTNKSKSNFKKIKKHRWPICMTTGLQRLGERKDAQLALRAAARSRSRAALNGGEATWRVVRAWRCDGANGCSGWHLSSSPASPIVGGEAA